MKVMIPFEGVWRMVECSELDVVRLVASAKGIDDVDVEVLPEKASIKSKTVTARGSNLTEACVAFLGRVFG